LQNGKVEQYQSGSIMKYEEVWQKEVASMQLQLYNAYIRIKELSSENNNLKKLIKESQSEIDFNANI
jgi:peptidoglycan hydrolase CwlO-like protein